MKLSDPTSRKKDKDYDQSDVEHLLRKRPWHSYDQMVNWLKEEGDEDRRFTPGEVERMIADLSRLQERRVPFTKDPDRLCHEMKG
ncbi:hypothetical protein SAMN05444365_11332 [Micromonospora pattaloongensis]|uniref:Uncharacterized protein n=1 Tax=Micromonospora pattaloongensis TaxID=405436 RepID=A0A1H3SPL8_9ACTN|nr:hypothetical protein [Micromonospora pattaloongensis]SDZ39932.1 hypothetical protein SAMN05444365_11332 [Micromonospora pattaloongensis]